jgi:hypothetical protein|nr:hypothetical protein [Kofleriaceae bacterium]
MSRLLFLPMVAACSSASAPAPKQPPAPLAPLANQVAAPTLPDGPLSLRAKVPATPHADTVAAMKHWTYEVTLDREQIDDELARVNALLAELFPHPSTPRQTELLAKARALDLVSPLPAGYMDVNLRDILTWELDLCERPPGEMSHCWSELPPRSTGAPVELADVAGATVLTVRDFSREWPALDLDRLARATAIVVDMRAATGTDPRPLLPWLERLTGRAPFTPLREIDRPKVLDPYVAAYAARYASDARDPAVWTKLVGAMPAARGGATTPIAVIVGDGCGAACELIARSLVTYANATLYGQVLQAGRLDRDEPAVFVTPHSKIEVYFRATAYFLNADIERATGPTPEWDLRTRDVLPDDIIGFAARQLHAPPAKRCDAMPTAATRKVTTATCGVAHVHVQTHAPLSAIQRYAATCDPPVVVASYFGIEEPPPVAVLNQLAASDLVEHITIACERE